MVWTLIGLNVTTYAVGRGGQDVCLCLLLENEKEKIYANKFTRKKFINSCSYTPQEITLLNWFKLLN